jgi:hypothetical protein
MTPRQLPALPGGMDGAAARASNHMSCLMFAPAMTADRRVTGRGRAQAR